MNESQPVRRVARFGSAVQVIGLKLQSARDYILLFASVLRECPVRDVNHILSEEERHQAPEKQSCGKYYFLFV